MPYVEVITREPIPQELRVKIAKQLSDTVLTTEIGGPTETAKLVDWMWFRVIPAEDWAVGGEFSEKYVRGRLMCRANIIAPEALLNQELKNQAIAEVTKILRDSLGKDPNDDGTGVWVMLDEIPQGTWGVSGVPMTVWKLMDIMKGDVSESRKAEMKARLDGFEKMRKQFGIPPSED